ncbi:hypothetical protein CWI36_0017p0070 [Hamiltosporidium magnivora]|uniref:Leucine-rich repeat-containing protein n=1 Tax=Hamiltosporidium magnivora TaxID=148818 RepID=A0A4Q9LMQ8_9MICR|nr:hypothetical protein CWI36_0032p0010 [Hamiltosporidium magnivora]TBU09584.1 hypothetical protein CWI36_0017p0070 [Hamiltosporidium magnivora]
MYWKGLSCLSEVLLKTKKIHAKISRTYNSLLSTTRLSTFLAYILFTGFLRTYICVRITINFTNESCLKDVVTDQGESHIARNSHISELDCVSYQNQISFDPILKHTTQNCTEYPYNTYNKRPRIDSCVESEYNKESIRMDKTSIPSYRDSSTNEDKTINTNLFNIRKEGLFVDGMARCDKNNFIQHPLNTLTFDYSDNYQIKSRYFDRFNKPELNEICLNIKAITKSNIDIQIFKETLHILCYGWNTDFPVLRNKRFLDLVWTLYDLSCYAESDALVRLYKNLLPFLFSYMTDISGSNVFNMTNEVFIKYRKYFLPFLIVLYDSINLFFNSNTKELLFMVKKTNNKCDLVGINSTKEIAIRITPTALSLIEEDNIKDKKKLLFRLVNSYKIDGIKISSDNNYFVESRNLDIKFEFANDNSDIYEMKASFCSVFCTPKSLRKNEIKSIEFERIFLSVLDISFLYELINLESLILVKCEFIDSNNFFLRLSSNFQNLKVLRIINFNIQNGFFNNLRLKNLEILDLSYCKYKGNCGQLNPEKIKLTKEFIVENSLLNYKIMDSIIINNHLDVLSMKGINFKALKFFGNCANWNKSFRLLDLSGCILANKLVDFFSTNLKCEMLFLDTLYGYGHLNRILSQNSLHTSTWILSISGNVSNSETLTNLYKFERLEYLNLSNMPRLDIKGFDFEPCKFKSHLIAINLSKNNLNKECLASLGHFNRLESLNLSECNLEAGFIESLCCNNLLVSLKRMNLTQNKLIRSDMETIEAFVNLTFIAISSDSEEFSHFFINYGRLKYPKLEISII